MVEGCLERQVLTAARGANRHALRWRIEQP